MSYGDYNGPDKPNKGMEGGACNRSSCQAEPALWYNHGSLKWYCLDCAVDIGLDEVNLAGWKINFGHRGHPMFETREMMNNRQSATGRMRSSEPELQDLRRLGGRGMAVMAATQIAALAAMDFRQLEERVLTMRPDFDVRKDLRYFDFYGGASTEYTPVSITRHVDRLVHSPPPNPRAEKRKAAKVAEMKARRARRKK